MEHITERQKSEEVFFDRYAGEVGVEELARHPLFSQCAFENLYAAEVMGRLKGRRVLDLGCGWGEDAVWFAEQGAYTVGVDVSPKMLFLARGLASRKRVGESVLFLRAAAESLPFGSESFDVVFGRGTLHHVDLSGTLSEIYRILKPGGITVFSEPLADNPILGVYRKFNRSIRTPMEKPIRYRDLARIGAAFDSFDHMEFKLFTMVVLALYYMKSKLSGSFHTGWFRDLDYGFACRRSYCCVQKMDSVILRFFPCLGRWCWLTVMVGRKR
ncbi:MAG: class I SAM-dependent methyltransferase [Candidatus Aureabacteria bacterium]|nr:class I SAM-dependent methyltransferase [Candidatus Auribacterota bacterium]